MNTIKQLAIIPRFGSNINSVDLKAAQIKKVKPKKVRNMSRWCNIKNRYVYDNEK